MYKIIKFYIENSETSGISDYRKSLINKSAVYGKNIK